MHRGREAVVLLAVAATGLVASASSGSSTAAARGTLFGILERGPTRPVCLSDEPCEGPAPGVTLIFSRAGSVAGRVVTGREGGYRIRLPAGRYAVRTNRRRFGTIPYPSTARVVAGRARRVDFVIDTGIR